MSEVRAKEKAGGGVPVNPRSDQPWYVRRIIHGGRQEQINIPRPILHRLGIRKGDQLIVWMQGTTICMKAAKLEQIFSQEGPL